MSLNKAFNIIEGLKQNEIIQDYAIGGAFAAIVYIETIFTQDIDIFYKTESTGILDTSYSNILEWLKNNNIGFTLAEEHIVFEGITFQFLPASGITYNALNNCILKDFDGVKVKVISPEYLMIIMLDVYRPKDRERLLKFHEEKVYDPELLTNLLIQYNLTDKWNIFYRTFLELL